MAAGEIRKLLILSWLAGSACTAGPETSVAIAVLNLEEAPQRLLKVCLAKRCTEVNTVLEHGDEAIVTVQPRDDSPLAFTVEARGGMRVVPCDVRVPAGLTGSLQVALSQGKARVLENKLHAARGSP
jgi:hypothetical protein